MTYKYTGKPLSKKQANEFLERIRMKPKGVYDYNQRTKKFVKRSCLVSGMKCHIKRSIAGT